MKSTWFVMPRLGGGKVDADAAREDAQRFHQQMKTNQQKLAQQLHDAGAAQYEAKNAGNVHRHVWFVGLDKPCKQVAAEVKQGQRLVIPPGVGEHMKANQAAALIRRAGQQNIYALEGEPLLIPACAVSRHEILSTKKSARWVELNLLTAGIDLKNQLVDERNRKYAAQKGGVMPLYWKDQDGVIERKTGTSKRKTKRTSARIRAPRAARARGGLLGKIKRLLD